MARKISYEPHPVSAERKAELMEKGYKIIDIRFKPAGEKAAEPVAKPVVEPIVEAVAEPVAKPAAEPKAVAKSAQSGNNAKKGKPRKVVVK